jgi:hypothetical protein
VKEQVIKGKVLVLYQRTEDMVVDIGTKPVTYTILNRLFSHNEELTIQLRHLKIQKTT